MRGLSISQKPFLSSPSRCSAKIRSWSCTFLSLLINDLHATLPSSVNCSLYADNLAIWSSSPSVSTVGKATQGALFRLERWSEYWCPPLNPIKCEASFFSVDLHQANLQLKLLLLGSRLRFNLTSAFLGVTFDRSVCFSKHVSSLKVKFFPRLKALLCISASSWAPARSPFLFCINLFFGPFTRMVFFSKRYQYHQIGTPPPSGQSRHHRLPLVLPYPTSYHRGFLPPLRVTLTHFTFSPYGGLFVFQPPFLFQVWPDLE